jgi:hypothetical protein
VPLPNPPVSLAVLLTTWTTAVVRKTIVNALVTAGTRADLWPVGDAVGSVLTDVSDFIAGQSSNVLDAISAGWLPTATGGWLDWIAFYFYGITRTPATFASGSLTLTNFGGRVFAYAPGEATFQDAITLQTYTNVDPIALAAGPGTTQTLAIVAVNRGTVGNAAPGEISILVTTMLGVTASNAAPVLGVDAQGDDDLRQECWNSLGARSVRGPRTAYAFAIQQATNPISGTPVNINRSKLSESSHTGQVVLFVASPSGAPDPDDVTGVNNAIEQIVRPGGVSGPGGVIAYAAQAVSYGGAGGQLTVYMPPRPGLTQATVQAAVGAALSLFFENYPIGGLTADGFAGVHASGVEAAAASAYPNTNGTGIFAVDSPGDLELVPGQVAVNAILAANIQVRFVSN